MTKRLINSLILSSLLCVAFAANTKPKPQNLDTTLTKISGKKPSELQKHIKEQKKASETPLGISFFEPSYILPVYYTANPDQAVYTGHTPDGQKLKNLEFKGQLSFMVPVWRDMFGKPDLSLNVSYTQLSYWQFYAKSQYFRETDYEPAVFLSYNFHKNWLLYTGIVHQSNGRGGDMERSWNRAYLNFMFSRGRWMFSVKPWVLIFKADSSDLHNPDIRRYLGNGRLLIAYKRGRNELSFMSRNNLQSGFKRGAIELTYSFHVLPHFYIYTQYFNGYGQSLIEYNHRTQAYGIGIALNDWL
ncbi:MAG: phospholipase [Gammaproteobacteria bacterium CG11_big_fil_rev_8_21_14_0_20_46_22]|nr:MAG: phospholipase [Gammaproteobacteria bacterium CG12_big_fil_rev_8_21_14_0_65_46_12]PIR10693.1 MAG: phospholipase [Gammaproteobacteria bacterium CG11_big_fil_rev_8_21_14_0_20_46_22]